MASWFVYLLRCEDTTLYTGISTDVQARFEKHRCGQGAAYTRSHKPVAIVWVEPAFSRSVALKREAEIKRWTKEKKEQLLLRSIDTPEKTRPKRKTSHPKKVGARGRT